MKTSDYAKAFKVLTDKLRKIVRDRKARLVIYVDNKLCLIPSYYCQDSLSCLFTDDNEPFIVKRKRHCKPCLSNARCKQTMSLSKLSDLSRNDYMELWFQLVIGNTLLCAQQFCVGSNQYKLLDKHETVESLCVEYDMKL